MNRRVAAAAALLSLVSGVMVPSARADAGTSGGQFLKIGVGAKAVGMGEAYSAIADDASAIFWNPAGIARIRNTDVSATHISYFQDITYQYLACARAVSPVDSLGVMVNYLSMPSITKYDNLGNELSDSYAPADLAATMSWGRMLSPVFAAGVNIKYVSSSIDTESASTVAADLGAFYQCTPRLSLAAAVRNMGGEMKFISEADPLPLTARLGSAYALTSALTLALDADYLFPEATANAHAGCSYTLQGSKDVAIAIRGGYRTETAESIEAAAGLTAGVGFRWKESLSVDVGWAPYGDLGDATQITLGYRFGSPVTVSPQPQAAPAPAAASPIVPAPPNKAPEKAPPAPVKNPAKAGGK